MHRLERVRVQHDEIGALAALNRPELGVELHGPRRHDRRRPYPAALAFVEPAGPRDLLAVGLRILLAIPHFIVLVCLMTAWWITTIVAWFVILATGRYPQALYDFGVVSFQWLIRVEAYMLLLIDEYPPFSFD